MAKGLAERKEQTIAITQDDRNVSTVENSQPQDVEANTATATTKSTITSSQNVADNNKDATNNTDNQKPSSVATKTTTLLALQMANIMGWYWTNGMNGIAMQAYAGQVAEAAEDSPRSSRFFATLVITSMVTCFQLLLGALIGRLLLLGINRQITWDQICQTRSIPLASLHAAGSLATNLGFMYGKASLVQVIKLLEPFETLLLSQMLFREGDCSVGIVSSMLLVVGAATSLLKLQSKPPLPQAVIFALLSGVTLSTRNVLQRKHHHTSVVAKSWSKLEKSVVQFTQLSFYSGMWMAAFSSIMWLLIYTPTVHASWQVFLWHPLYNVFSMITLGFCSALTHSLLNAGKRVFAICMAMLWFAEGLNTATLSGLLAVASGGTWYSWEAKRNNIAPHDAAGHEFYKLAVSISALVALFAFHNAMAKEKE
jgi:hypothetical protein